MPCTRATAQYCNAYDQGILCVGGWAWGVLSELCAACDIQSQRLCQVTTSTQCHSSAAPAAYGVRALGRAATAHTASLCYCLCCAVCALALAAAAPPGAQGWQSKSTPTHPYMRLCLLCCLPLADCSFVSCRHLVSFQLLVLARLSYAIVSRVLWVLSRRLRATVLCCVLYCPVLSEAPGVIMWGQNGPAHITAAPPPSPSIGRAARWLRLRSASSIHVVCECCTPVCLLAADAEPVLASCCTSKIHYRMRGTG
jgi:hypothetical protein